MSIRWHSIISGTKSKWQYSRSGVCYVIKTVCRLQSTIAVTIDEVEIVADFLPSPEELVFRDETVKVTIALSRASVEFSSAEGEKTTCLISV